MTNPTSKQCSCPTCGAKYDAGPKGQSLEARSLEARKDVVRKALGEIERFFGLTPSAPETTAPPVAWRYKDSRGHWRYTGSEPKPEHAILQAQPLYE